VCRQSDYRIPSPSGTDGPCKTRWPGLPDPTQVAPPAPASRNAWSKLSKHRAHRPPYPEGSARPAAVQRRREVRWPQPRRHRARRLICAGDEHRGAHDRFRTPRLEPGLRVRGARFSDAKVPTAGTFTARPGLSGQRTPGSPSSETYLTSRRQSAWSGCQRQRARSPPAGWLTMPAPGRQTGQERGERRVDRAHRAEHGPAPGRSPSAPNTGAASVPTYWREAKAVRSSTEPV
jgi:hypothetical protein